jgi:hypothetical protein
VHFILLVCEPNKLRMVENAILWVIMSFGIWVLHFYLRLTFCLVVNEVGESRNSICCFSLWVVLEIK